MTGNGSNRSNNSFVTVLQGLVGETVRILTNSTTRFFGKLADVATTYVTLAVRSSHGSARVNLVFIPVRHINAITQK